MHLRRIFSLVSLATLASVAGLAAQAHGGHSVGGPAPAAAVERLLRLAETRSYREMGSVFGTTAGAVTQQWPTSEVEQRMYAIASILEHDRFVIRGEQPIPGRMGVATRVMVDITKNGRTTQVPFVAVKSGSSWLVEQVDLERLTRAE